MERRSIGASTRTVIGPATNVLTAAAWQARVDAHVERAQRWTVPHRERRSRHEEHPVHDFLFQYYMYSPGKLETWHPAPSESIEDSPEARDRFGPPEYRAEKGCPAGSRSCSPRRREGS